MTAYDLDVHAWAFEQADALKRRSANELDWDNLAEELASLGKQQAWELYNRYVVLLAHLLKWIHQPGRRSRSWTHTVNIQRREIEKYLRQNPSLKAVEPDEFAEAYATARLQAASETGLLLESFPDSPEFTPAQAKDQAWWPGQALGRDG